MTFSKILFLNECKFALFIILFIINKVNKTVSASIRIDNNAVINPYEDEMDTDETLEDLGPELAKMG